MDLLAGAIPKRDYLLVRPTVTRLVNTQMPAAVLAINEATTQEAKRASLAEHAAAGQGNWEMKFLREVLHVQS